MELKEALMLCRTIYLLVIFEDKNEPNIQA